MTASDQQIDQLLTASDQQTDQLLTARDQQTDRIRLTANWIRKPEVSIEAVAVEMANAEEAAEEVAVAVETTMSRPGSTKT